MEIFDFLNDLPGWATWALFVLFSMAVVLGLQIQRLEKEAQRRSEDIDEIIEWLKEIDPRLEEERDYGSGYFPHQLELSKEKSAKGERTLRDPLRREWRRKEEE